MAKLSYMHTDVCKSIVYFLQYRLLRKKPRQGLRESTEYTVFTHMCVRVKLSITMLLIHKCSS